MMGCRDPFLVIAARIAAGCSGAESSYTVDTKTICAPVMADFSRVSSEDRLVTRRSRASPSAASRAVRKRDAALAERIS